MERGLAHASGNRALYVRLLRSFSRDFGQFHDRFAQAMAGGDGEAAIRLAHTVKGLAGAIGAQDLRHSAAALEAVLSDGADPLVLNRALPAVVSDIARVVCDIDACLEPKPGAEDGAAGQSLPPVTASMLDGLRRRLMEADVSATDELDALFARWPHLRTALAEVGECLDQYRFDEALAALEAFAGTLSDGVPAT
ncbi:MAG: Hpt domain-containing protein [Magnetospirillum sp.]|nr:Hpt domain-containing protein [Magnetospirillum sp.]